MQVAYINIYLYIFLVHDLILPVGEFLRSLPKMEYYSVANMSKFTDKP